MNFDYPTGARPLDLRAWLKLCLLPSLSPARGNGLFYPTKPNPFSPFITHQQVFTSASTFHLVAFPSRFLQPPPVGSAPFNRD